jgi:hypothetical protein
VRRTALISVMLAVAACAAEPLTPLEVEERWLGFLHSGQTTREDVITRLGIPSASFENDRILTYRLSASEAGVSSRWFGSFHLVLVFDERGRLAEHTLLQP